MDASACFPNHARSFTRSDALGGGWRVLARLGSLVPVALADAVYDAVAKRRYRTFGKLESCPIPPPEWRARFIEDDKAETFFTTE